MEEHAMFGNTPLVIIQTQEQLSSLAKSLCSEPVVGVDTESDSFYHYQEKVCLIQFSDREKDYIVDPLLTPDLSDLAPLFSDGSIVKIFHGADYDIVCLKRDFGFTIHNLFDTMIAAQLLALPRLGLADLIYGHFGGEKIDKKYQRHNWALRPLEDEHLEYARGDTHFLLALREILIHKLKVRGRLGDHIEECTVLERREWPVKSFDPDGYLKIKQSKHLDDTAKRVIRRLYLFRDQSARELDRPTFKVLPDSVLVDVAEHQPKTERELDALFPRKHQMKRRYGAGMVEAVVQGLGDDFPIPLIKREKAQGPTPALSGRTAERVFAALKLWRNTLCDKTEHLVPIGVASNGVLKNIINVYPKTLEELGEVPDIRRWQVRTFGEEILKVLQTAVESPDEASDKPSRRRRKR